MSQLQYFEVKDDHIKLLKNLQFGSQAMGGYVSRLYIDEKRPYGNSDIYSDIAEIIGIELDDSTEMQLKLEDLHGQMATVLEIFCRNLSIQPGIYEAHEYMSDWRLTRAQ